MEAHRNNLQPVFFSLTLHSSGLFRKQKPPKQNTEFVNHTNCQRLDKYYKDKDKKMQTYLIYFYKNPSTLMHTRLNKKLKIKKMQLKIEILLTAHLLTIKLI